MKKRLLFLSVLALSLASCTKPLERMASVRFSLGVENGAIPSTRSVSDALSATLPAGPFSLHLQSEENSLRTYDVSTGEDVSVAVGSYSVSGSGSGEVLVSNNNVSVVSSPAWAVDSGQTVAVSEDGAEIGVSAHYTCPAFVFDLSEVKKVVLSGNPKQVEVTTFPGSEGYGVVYPVGNWYSSKPLWMYVYPVDEVLGETALYKFVSGSSSGEYIGVEAGRWYKFSPGKAEVVSGRMGVTFPEWEEGE